MAARSPLSGQRRRLIQAMAALSGLAAAGRPIAAPAGRLIPSSKEPIAPIGMGTWITFNIGKDPALLAQRSQVLQAFFAAGGGMIDSSPMYGSAQQVLGELLPASQQNLFSATKVWTGSNGQSQVQEAHRLWRRSRFDLLQVHNLLNWQSHLSMLRDMKAAQTIRYLGITTSHGRRHADFEQIMRTEALDFVQFTYNVADRDVEQRLLPLARDKGIAVIINRPFRRGSLTQRLQGRALPPIAGELQCQSWAELLLKFVISHPAVTCAIPATSRVDHMQQNMRAGTGPMPDASQREIIATAAG